MIFDSSFNTKTFANIWQSYSDFITDINDSDLEMPITEDSMKVLYYLLYANYGNSPIVNRDITQFKYRVYTIILQYGGEWEKKLEIQKTILNLTEDQIKKGDINITNGAVNPSVAPDTEETGELGFVDSQSVNKNIRGILEAYQLQWQSLDSNITSTFIKRFKPLFSKFGTPYINPVYEIDE